MKICAWTDPVPVLFGRPAATRGKSCTFSCRRHADKWFMLDGYLLQQLATRASSSTDEVARSCRMRSNRLQLNTTTTVVLCLSTTTTSTFGRLNSSGVRTSLSSSFRQRPWTLLRRLHENTHVAKQRRPASQHSDKSAVFDAQSLGQDWCDW